MRSETACRGVRVRIDATWAPFYRKVGTPTEGTILRTSPDGAVACVRIDDVCDSYVRIEHLEPVGG